MRNLRSSTLRNASMLFLGTAALLVSSTGIQAQTTTPAPPPTSSTQTSPTTPPPETQGMGDQRGAGTSPNNSSNGGYGTMRHTRRHKHRNTSPDGTTPTPGTTNTPGTTTPPPPQQ